LWSERDNLNRGIAGGAAEIIYESDDLMIVWTSPERSFTSKARPENEQYARDVERKEQQEHFPDSLWRREDGGEKSTN